MKHYAVIGRIPGDDEDSCYIYFTSSCENAIERFEHEIYADDLYADKEYNIRAYGTAVFINHVLCSDTVISKEA